MCWWQISVYFRYSRILWCHQSTVTYQIQQSCIARVTKHFDDVTIFWSIENCSNKPLWLTHSESALNIWIFGLKLAQFHGRKFFYLNGKKFTSKLSWIVDFYVTANKNGVSLILYYILGCSLYNTIWKRRRLLITFPKQVYIVDESRAKWFLM